MYWTEGVHWILAYPLKEDSTGHVQGLALDEVNSAINTYMRWLYFIGTISVPTKVSFARAALADDSRGFHARKYEPSKTKILKLCKVIETK